MGSVATIAVSVTARIDKFVKRMTKAQKRLKRFTNAIRQMARRAARLSIALSGLGLAAIYLFAKVAQAGERFNQKLRRSQAIMSGLSMRIRAEMKKTAFDVARVTKFSAEQAAESYFYLASAGLTAKQSIAALPTMARFAQAGMFDMARATDLLTDAQSALGMTVKDTQQNMANMRRIGDVLVKANKLANASVEEFAESLTTKAAAKAKTYGIAVEEVTAVLAAFADQGIKGADAGTAFDIVVRDLTTKVLKNARAFRKWGVAVWDSSNNLRNLALIVADLEAAQRGRTDMLKKSMLLEMGFADRSVSHMQKLIGTSRLIARYERELWRAAGTMKAVADAQLTAWEKAVAKISTAWTRLSDSLQPVLAAVAYGVEKIAGKMEGLSNILTPDVVTKFLETTLNALHQWWLEFKRGFALFAQGMNETVASVLSTFGADVPEQITKNIDFWSDIAAGADEALRKVKTYNQLMDQLTPGKTEQQVQNILMRRPYFNMTKEDFPWGVQVKEKLVAPMKAAAAEFQKGQAAAMGNYVRDLWGRLRAFIETHPPRLISSKLMVGVQQGLAKLFSLEGWGRALAEAQAALRPRSPAGAGAVSQQALQFREIALGRTAVAGLSAKASRKQLVHDPALDKANAWLEMIAIATRHRAAGGAVTGP